MVDWVAKIKKTGYWRIEIRPTEYEEKRIPNLPTAQEIIEACQVRLRGWYPHIDEDGIINKINYIESGIDWHEHTEYWRFYLSGQFIHYLTCWEDYSISELKEKAKKTVWLRWPHPEPNAFLEIFVALYTLTEVFEFAIRLAQRDLLTPAAYINISLNGARDRMLFFWDWRRHLRGRYISRVDTIPLESTLPPDELIATGHDVALNKTVELLNKFNWNDVPREVLAEQQRKLLERRF